MHVPRDKERAQRASRVDEGTIRRGKGIDDHAPTEIASTQGEAAVKPPLFECMTTLRDYWQMWRRPSSPMNVVPG